MVGPDIGEEEESFDVLVCSPAWLAQQRRPIIGRHHLIVEEFDYFGLERSILEYLAGCDGPNWRYVAEKVGRLGRWEFEHWQE
jgi:hypothetical protein